MRIRTSTEAFGLVLLGAALGCASPPPSSAPAKNSGPAPVTSVERYCPLKADTVFQYETFSENTGEKGVLIMSVERPTSVTATLVVGGKAERLELGPSGIRLAAGGWLLKAPLAPDARFRGQFGEVVVRSIDRSIEVPAGRFSGCVETVEESRTVQKRVTTVFCPDVGIVLLEAEGALGDGEYGKERAALKSHGPRVDINAPPPPGK